MDRQDAKPRRPSLMAGASRPESPGPSPARILADMDGPQPTSAPPRSLTLQRALILAAVVVGLLGIVWWWQSAREPAVTPPLITTSGAIHSAAEADGGSGAATIIDEPSPASGATALASGHTDASGAGHADADPMASPFASAEAPSASPASDEADAGNPFIPAATASNRTAATPAARPAAAQTGKTKARRSSSSKERDLMATLLGNITPRKGEPTSSELDSLIQKMEASEAKTVASKQPAAAAARPSRSQQIQSNLRECPPANTAKGLKCRQEICAVYAGRDPACPAN